MMTQQQKNELFIHNTDELNKLNTGSGSMIKALLQGIELNANVYIRLSDATEDGHKVNYTHIEGDRNVVLIVGGALGLTITETFVETPLA